MSDETKRLDVIQEQLGRLTAIVARLHVLQETWDGIGKLQMALELVRLADELGAPMSENTRGQILRQADAIGLV